LFDHRFTCDHWWLSQMVLCLAMYVALLVTAGVVASTDANSRTKTVKGKATSWLVYAKQKFVIRKIAILKWFILVCICLLRISEMTYLNLLLFG